MAALKEMQGGEVATLQAKMGQVAHSERELKTELAALAEDLKEMQREMAEHVTLPLFACCVLCLSPCSHFLSLHPSLSL